MFDSDHKSFHSRRPDSVVRLPSAWCELNRYSHSLVCRPCARATIHRMTCPVPTFDIPATTFDTPTAYCVNALDFAKAALSQESASDHVSQHDGGGGVNTGNSRAHSPFRFCAPPTHRIAPYEYRTWRDLWQAR